MKDSAASCHPSDHSPHVEVVPTHSAAGLDRAARLFRAMGDGPRLRLLERLAHREYCVTELVEELGEKFPTISQRLRILRGEGLISRRRQGTHLFYALADRHVADLIHNALAHADELETAKAPDKRNT